MPQRSQINVLFSEAQLKIIDELRAIETIDDRMLQSPISRSQLIRDCVMWVARRHNAEWPDDLNPHGDFSRAREKRWDRLVDETDPDETGLIIPNIPDDE